MYRRRLFYLSGFDPRGGRFYHALHEQALARHAALSGQPVTVSPRRKGESGVQEWDVVSPACETRVGFLRWDDLVSRVWVRAPHRLGWRALAAYAGYLAHLDIAYGWRTKRGVIITLFYPLVAALLLPLVIGAPVAWVSALAGLPGWMAALVGLAVGVGTARPLLGKLRACWLVRLFIFNHDCAACGFSPEITERIDAFAASLATALESDADEVLLVAHSNGAVLAVPLLLRLLELRGGNLPANFTLVTMGNCIPLLGARRDAVTYQGMLRALSGHAFDWIDIGSPPDGACFSLSDPFEPSGSHGAVRLVMLSPRFHRFWKPENYHTGWASKYEVHFDYLRCGDSISPIDYPSLTVAPRPVADSVAMFRGIA